MEEKKVKKQIVIFGGSFNPPSNSHFSLAQQIINLYNQIEKVIFVPVNSKYQKQGLIDNEHRYQMLKRVCEKNNKFEVSRLEIDSNRALYTIETLKEFQEKYPSYEVCFIMGSDNLKELSTWKNAEEIVKKFKIYVFERDKDNVDEIIENDKFLKNNFSSISKASNKIKNNLSSTFIREEIKNKKSIKYLVPDEIIEYIEKNELYKGDIIC